MSIQTQSRKDYAIIKTGGKQYPVAIGDVIDVELLEAEKGQEVQFNEVLFLHEGSSLKVGSPTVAGCVVKGLVLDMSKGPKIQSVKYKPSHNQYKTFGHRQKYLRIKITSIGA